jgi:hypothetical protein
MNEPHKAPAQWWWEAAPRGEVLAFVLVTAAVMFVQLLHGGLFDIDGYYHVRMAEGYLSGWVAAAGGDFHWTQHSIWNGGFSDKDYLWHLFLVPFVWVFGGDMPGIERAGMVGAAVGAGIGAIVAVRVLRANRVVHPMLWVLLLYSAGETFLYRVSLCRSYLLSIPLALLGWHLIQHKGRWALAAVAAIYTLAYTAPHLLFVLAVFWALAEWFGGEGGGKERTKSALAPFFWIALGIAAGLLMHPEPVNMLRMWAVQNLAVPLHSYGMDAAAAWVSGLAGYGAGVVKVADIGLEMSGLSGRELISGHVIGLGLLALPWVWAARCGVRPDRTDAYAWLAAWAFFIGMLMSERFAEYLYPFAVVAAARLCSRCIESGHVEKWRGLHPMRWRLAAGFSICAICFNFVARPGRRPEYQCAGRRRSVSSGLG